MDEEELRDVLLEAMQNMVDPPGTDEESGLKGNSASGSAAGGFFARKLKRKGAAAKLSNEELEAAAHWLIERFGQEDDDDSDDEDTSDFIEAEPVRLAVKALLEVVENGAKNIEVALFRRGEKFCFLSDGEVASIVESIEEERAEEEKKANAKKSKK